MSRPVTVSIPHQLGKQEARNRLQEGRDRMRSHLAGVATSIDEEWQGDTLVFRVVALAQTITGRIEVLDDSVEVEVDLPWMLAMLAEKIKGRVRHQGALMLTKK
ncbi:polyhydroxyalkanoic acid system family protein [Arenibaculum sp.]|jgi:putative polyhydroxyalkanoate system protein|uniref:polyhydroxyalkanoic acid system family protein n=1 Tax=Arenibaculum sp. TaxID=2865862 RepID=UPI002E0DF219|nr:polyhydroxyalkanoic acid system family protein [Arenibaculum sp.]